MIIVLEVVSSLSSNSESSSARARRKFSWLSIVSAQEPSVACLHQVRKSLFHTNKAHVQSLKDMRFIQRGIIYI